MRRPDKALEDTIWEATAIPGASATRPAPAIRQCDWPGCSATCALFVDSADWALVTPTGVTFVLCPKHRHAGHLPMTRIVRTATSRAGDRRLVQRIRMLCECSWEAPESDQHEGAAQKRWRQHVEQRTK